MTHLIMRETRRRTLLSASASALGFLLAFGAGPALAQEPKSEDQAQAVTVDEIVVTARRRDERLQDVPVAVTALSAQALENLQASDIGDLQGAVPNLTLHEGDASNAVVYVRGVGQVDSLAFADPGVGIYLDDVYLAEHRAPSCPSMTWTGSRSCADHRGPCTVATPSAGRSNSSRRR